jgi:hypothetical protein
MAWQSAVEVPSRCDDEPRAHASARALTASNEQNSTASVTGSAVHHLIAEHHIFPHGYNSMHSQESMLKQPTATKSFLYDHSMTRLAVPELDG